MEMKLDVTSIIQNITPKKYSYHLLDNVHLSLPPPTLNGATYLTNNNFTYFHYGCDGLDDSGWGCAYRTLQSSCSWIRNVLLTILESGGTLDDTINHGFPIDVPSLNEIQAILVSINDKPKTFYQSRDWIGALEVFYTIDATYGVTCKIIHVPRNDDLKKFANIIKNYFIEYGGLVMMGGDVDASSKGIAGIHIFENQVYFLIVDPHFIGHVESAEELIERGYIRWQHSSEFIDSSFYNLCLPQIKLKH